MSVDFKRVKNVGVHADPVIGQMVYYAVDIHDNMAIYTEEDGWKYINATQYRIEGEVTNVKT